MSILIKKEQIDKTLANVPVRGKRMLEVKTLSKEIAFPYGILEDYEVSDNEAEVHKFEADLWICLEGNPIFTYGGELVNSWVKENKDGTKNENELKAKEISGGETVILKPGDVLWIPAGESHQHQCPTGTARMVIIKIPLRN